ncbi:hypothetical protein M407DRAFT_12083 [Tulasnella calospora MUT 4182]|uniref:Uncharacterized protein n=1 Tax=Tulasnella calospora MUT 4182 TaxID=1051891 RepID=A0A0C3Q469_9AGAM|nr:hypothetical protein M407DRAFT_12083 [Tulasnella calospora MUT 4182]
MEAGMSRKNPVAPLHISVTISITTLQSKASARAIAKNRKPKVEVGGFKIDSDEPYNTFKAQLLACIDTTSSPASSSFSNFEFESYIPRLAPTPTKYSTEVHHQALLEKLHTKKKGPYELKFNVNEIGPDIHAASIPQAEAASAKARQKASKSNGTGSSRHQPNTVSLGSRKEKRLRGESTDDSDLEERKSGSDCDPAAEAEKPAKKKKKEKGEKKKKKDSGVPKEAKLSDHAKRLAEQLLDLKSRWECQKKDCPNSHCWMKGPEVATIDNPPNHHLFNIDLASDSTLVQGRRHTACTAKKTEATTMPSITINMPPEAFSMYSVQLETIEKLKSRGVKSTTGWEYAGPEELRLGAELNLGEYLEFRGAFEAWAHSNDAWLFLFWYYSWRFYSSTKYIENAKSIPQRPMG